MGQALLSLLQVKVSAPRAQPLYNPPASVAGFELGGRMFCPLLYMRKTYQRSQNGSATGDSERKNGNSARAHILTAVSVSGR